MKEIFVLFFLASNYCNAQKCDDYLLKFEDFNIKGDYRNAILFGQLAVDSCNDIKNSDSYKNTLINLGLAYKKTQNYFKAKYYYLTALEILKKEGSEDSLQYAFLLDNMGNLYTASKEFKKAKKCYVKSKVLIGALLGKNSKDYLIQLGNLANFYTETKKYKEAEKVYFEIFEIQKQIRENDFNLAIGYDNYGNFLRIRGNYANSIMYRQKALDLLKKTVGFFHPDYLITLQNLIGVYSEIGDTLRLEENLENAVEISRIISGDSAEETLLLRNQLKEFYVQSNRLAKLPDLYLEEIKLFSKKFGKNSVEVIAKKIELADCYFKIEEFQKAEELFLQIKISLNETKQENTLNYLTCNSALSKIYKINRNYEKAIQYQIKTIDIVSSIFGKESEEYVSSIIELGYLQTQLDDFDNGENNFLTAIKKSEYKFEKNYIIATHNLADLYQKKGEYKKAEDLLLNTLSQKEKVYGKNSIEYANTLNSLVVNYLESNQIEKVEKYLNQISSIYKKTLKINDKLWFRLYSNFATYYEQINNDKKALYYYNKIEESLSSLDSLDQAYYRSLLGGYYANSENFEKAFLTYASNLDYYLNKNGEAHPKTAVALFNFGTLWYDAGMYVEAENYIASAYVIMLESKKFKDSTTMKQLGVVCLPMIESLAKCFMKNGKTEMANIMYIKSIALNKRIFGEQSSFYSRSLVDYAFFLEKYDTINNIKIADSLIYISEKIGLKNLKTQLSLLSNPVAFNIIKQEEINKSFAFSFLTRNTTPNLTEELLNYDLFIKNILLAKNNQIIGLNTNELDAKQNTILENYKKINIFITKYFQKLNDDSLSFNNLIDSSEKLENVLIELIPQLRNVILERKINWIDISKKLNKNEIAIDFVNFKYKNIERFTDTTIYAAFVIQPDLKQPKYIKLFYENELLDLFSQNNSVNEIYNEPALSLYNLIIKPLDTLLNGVKKIYISPSGLLHRISFSGISTFENKKLLEKYEIETLSNLSSIVNKKKSTANINSFFLFGDIDYDNEPTGFKNYNLNNDSTLSFSRSLINGKWRRLISTGAEIKYISKLSDSLGIKSIIYNGQVASEENFKSIKSPTVLHIATHGISVPIINLQPNDKRNKYSIELVKKTPIFSRSEDPLTRSALILAGANRFWLHGETYPNHDDGILTAREVSNLDLSNCELATLSACETGLGEINGSEGVFGLQRGFKMAGVHYLIVSLWKVPDAETADFMQTFYSKWLKDKNEIKDAFRKTQLEMSDKYKEPYKWAAFTLIE